MCGNESIELTNSENVCYGSKGLEYSNVTVVEIKWEGKKSIIIIMVRVSSMDSFFR